MKVAIIPARGGSKRIPRKNIKLFCGKPIISYSIRAAIQSGCFDKVIVSTDCLEIKECAEKYGAEVPFLRSKELSGDYMGIQPVISDVCRRLEKIGHDLSLCATILPTSPTLTSERLVDMVQKLNESVFGKVFAVSEYSYPVLRSFTLEENKLSMLFPEHLTSRSQDLKKVYHDAGQCYMTTKPLDENISFLTSDTLPVITPHYLVQDIDTVEDWVKAELMYESLKKTDRL